MEEIKRYREIAVADVGGYVFPDMEEYSEGDYVEYSDHKAVVETHKENERKLELSNEVLEIQIKEATSKYEAQLEISMKLQNKIDELEKQIIEKDRLLFENEYGLV